MLSRALWVVARPALAGIVMFLVLVPPLSGAPSERTIKEADGGVPRLMYCEFEEMMVGLSTLLVYSAAANLGTAIDSGDPEQIQTWTEQLNGAYQEYQTWSGNYTDCLQAVPLIA